MPIVRRIGPYEFRFYSRGEAVERPHIHARRERSHAKFWLDEVELVTAHGFAARELNQIRRIVEANRDAFLEAWFDYFD